MRRNPVLPRVRLWPELLVALGLAYSCTPAGPGAASRPAASTVGMPAAAVSLQAAAPAAVDSPGPVADGAGAGAAQAAVDGRGACTVVALDVDLLAEPDGVTEEALEEGGGVEDGEAEAALAEGIPEDGLLHYSADLSDAELERRFLHDLPALGSVSVGFADAGRIMNAVQLQSGDAWQVVVPPYAWGAQETIDAVTTVAVAVQARFPDARLRVNHISKKEGGHLSPHSSHQSGRDVDFGFYYVDGVSAGGGGNRAHLIDPARNWELVRALVTQTDVKLILVDRRIQEVLLRHALEAGEDPAWLDSLFKAGAASIVRHARRHRDHFHVRFYAPRSQELGRRVQPLLAGRPDENIAMCRVKSGDTLSQIARRYESTVSMIQKANGMRSTFLSIGRTLAIPLRGPCTRCPLPPPVAVPPRRLPPMPAVTSEQAPGQRQRPLPSSAPAA